VNLQFYITLIICEVPTASTSKRIQCDSFIYLKACSQCYLKTFYLILQFDFLKIGFN